MIIESYCKCCGNILLTDTDLEFLRLCCTELTYVQIADKMCKSNRTVEGYVQKLSEKLKVKGRQGLTMYAIKHEIYKPE